MDSSVTWLDVKSKNRYLRLLRGAKDWEAFKANSFVNLMFENKTLSSESTCYFKFFNKFI